MKTKPIAADKFNFTDNLKALFEQIEPELRAARVKSYRERAQREFDAWKNRLNGDKPADLTTGPFYQRDKPTREAMEKPRYIAAKAEATDGRYVYVSESERWNRFRDQINAGAYYVDMYSAERDANAEVDYAKAHFIAKQAKKLTKATEGVTATSAQVVGSLGYSAGRMTGHLDVDFGNGNTFSLDMSITSNCRYSGRRRTTYFYQYPARFTRVTMDHKRVTTRVSEGWMAENFKA